MGLAKRRQRTGGIYSGSEVLLCDKGRAKNAMRRPIKVEIFGHKCTPIQGGAGCEVRAETCEIRRRKNAGNRGDATKNVDTQKKCGADGPGDCDELHSMQTRAPTIAKELPERASRAVSTSSNGLKQTGVGSSRDISRLLVHFVGVRSQRCLRNCAGSGGGPGDLCRWQRIGFERCAV